MPSFRLRLPRSAAVRTLCLAAALLAAPGARAQVGTVHGRVLDTSGAPVAGAAVEFRRQSSSLQRGGVTDAQGAYRVMALPPGNYRVSISRSGYVTRRGALLLSGGEMLLHDWVLEARPLLMDTVVAIGGSEAVIRRSDTEFTTRLGETALELLPSTHDPAELVAHTPGARAGQVWGGATQQANSYQIDGLAANHPGLGGDLVKPSINWIESVEVRGLGAAAEYGNFQGGLINVNTKSGTNDFEGVLHASTETAGLTGSNLQRFDVASEVRSRYDLEAELRGPLVRNRLFYYVAGQWIRRDEQVVSHLWGRRQTGFYHPDLIDWTERKAFGKLLWQPTVRDQLTVSGGFLDTEADRFGLTGFETGASLRMTSPTSFYQAEFTHLFGPGSALEVAVGGFDRDERREPEDPSLPGIMATRVTPGPTYQNPAFSYRLAPSSSTVRASLSVAAQTFGITHALKLGGEYSAGAWQHTRTRNGGVTWRPQALRSDTLFDGDDPSTWYRFGSFVPTEWGGEVDLDADVRNGAVYLQDNIELGSRITVSPGVRFGWWEGNITPGGDAGPRFRAVRDARPEARLGLIFDVTGRNDFVVKAHAGRYHQSMFAQFYDRVEGGNVFSNGRKWLYYGPREAAGGRLDAARRDSLAAAGRFILNEEIRLSQSGPVENYRQPYVDQLVVGVEKQLGRWVKAEAVYVHRANGNMVALVDRNAATNYTAFQSIRVFDESGDSLKIHGSSVWLPRVYIPNYALMGIELPAGLLPPGTQLTWDPDYVLTTVPEAKRSFRQLQLVLRVGMPRVSGTLSVVRTDLRGNLDNVSGYGEDESFGAGPFTNPNQAVNFYGRLPNFSPWELKVSAYGELRWGVRGGFFWNEALGDHYSPYHNLSWTQNTYKNTRNQQIPTGVFASVTGQPMFIGDRGQLSYPNRSTVDLHLERGVGFAGAQWLFSLDAFNVFARDTPLRMMTAVNEPMNFNLHLSPGLDPSQYYGTVLQRQRPRALRLGTVVRF
jgi:hypothetical protein